VAREEMLPKVNDFRQCHPAVIVLEPRRYLTSVLAKLGQLPRDPAGKIPADELEQFLPDVWKKEDAAEPSAPEPPASAPPAEAPPAAMPPAKS